MITIRLGDRAWEIADESSLPSGERGYIRELRPPQEGDPRRIPAELGP